MSEAAPFRAEAFPLAFAILAHEEFSTLEALVQRLSEEPADSVVVHLDGKVAASQFRRLVTRFADRSNVAIMHGRRCHWGGISLVEATLDALRHLDELGRPYRHVSFLSGIDFPIRPVSELRAHLATDAHGEYIEAHNFYTERWIQRGLYAERF